jgi:DNA-directed RNA polymerase alpha subunit
MSESITLLETPLQELDLSQEFISMATQNGYATIGDILKMPLTEIPMLPNSGYRLLRELLVFLTVNDLADLIED